MLTVAGTGPEAAGGLLPLDAEWLAARLRRRTHHPNAADKLAPSPRSAALPAGVSA
ncbi:hypothetical protein HMPREF0731_2152 [Pseudoroseomonas cervicalis ATCC 49957]|uniref:Uncharacterized protein n=1 Tax=Pseudoroseomonas cervicalis ATCC 49957 TaxID=525371 RepID=D5RM41_9PROT|nr:hypothetical protein HMPREF0731_2152 [Pseudoroseomonas cervicalis ATCC 49957]